jgi:hypothetical protein
MRTPSRSVPLLQVPAYPLLFAAYFVLFLYAQNIELVRLTEIGSPLVWSLVGAALLLVAAALLMRSWQRGALVAAALVIAFLAYGHVRELAGEHVPEEWLIAGWLAVILAAAALALFRRTPLGSITSGLNAVAAVLLVFVLATIVPHNLQPPARAETGATPSGLTAERQTRRDIYYIVFDRYGSRRALEAGFGITDNDLYDWLAQRGFDVVDGARANYMRTTLSLASTLNVTHLSDVAGREGPTSTDPTPIDEMIQTHRVGRFLREQGYRYVHIGSWFRPTRSVRIADESIEARTATEFEAVLYETTAMPLVDERFGGPERQISPKDRSQLENGLFQFRALNRVVADPGPKLVIAHVLLPHDPYVFDADGRFVPPDERADEPIEQQFRRQLEFTNRQIKALVERLLARPEAERPIIAIQADEGPYPARYQADVYGFDWSTATTAELETKYGILSAFYLPDEPGQPADVPEPYPGMTSVNTFPMLLARYFGVELPYLPDRSYTSRSARYVYDMTDITDRLPPP